MENLPALRRNCPACGRALGLHERFAGGHCHDWQCKRQRVEAARRAALVERLTQERDAEAAAVGLPAAAPVVMLPAHAKLVEAPPASLRQALQTHLMGLQAEVEALRAAEDPGDAAAGPAAEPPASPTALPADVAALLGQICATCGGRCCRFGLGQHAFIDADLLHRVWRLQPAASYDDLVEGYLAALPQRHLAQSCGFHGERGCTLPRERRSDICNHFECRPYEQAQRLAETQGVRRIYLVLLSPENGHVGSFVPPP